MQIAPTLPPAAPAPTGAPTPAENGDSGFAEMLKGEVNGEANVEIQGEVKGEAKTKGEAARTPRRDAVAEATTDAAEAATAELTGGTEAGVAQGNETPLDPTLAHWLAGLHMPPPAEPRSTASTRAAGAAALGEGEPAAAGVGSTPARGGARCLAGAQAERPAADARAAARDAARAAAAAPAGSDAEAARGVAASAASVAAAAPRQTAPDPSIIATPVAAAPAAPVALAAPPGSVDVQLPLAPDAAGFGEAFATQVSVLARDGVQQAELHLNPAETGPVSIQIVLEGTQARIEFGADALPTRQAIEQSLPELAAALREEGLTLSGGGVSEHARGRDPAAAEHTAPLGTRRDADAAPAAPTLHSVRMPRSAGGIDLYA